MRRPAAPSVQPRTNAPAPVQHPRDPARAVAFGSARDIPRALEHPAFNGVAFNIVGVLLLDDESDGAAMVA